MMKANSIFIILAFFGLGFFSCDQGKKQAVIETEFGEIVIELYDQTPAHKDNFVKLAKEGFYDGTLFHRIIPGFMIQGGDPSSIDAPQGVPLGSGGPGYQIKAEIGAPHFRGTVAAARNSNPEKKSSGSQFYIVVGKPVSDGELNNWEQQRNITYNDAQREKYKEFGGSPMLDGEYTVFGEVVEGMDVVEKIISQDRDSKDRPTVDIPMQVKMLR